MYFHKQVLDLDPEAETARIVAGLHQSIRDMHKRGGVIGVSGGVDSAVTLALAVRAFGPRRVVALTMPERDSELESAALAQQVADHFGVPLLHEDITAALEGFGCYARRDAAIRRIFPAFDAAAGYKAKIVLPPDLLNEETLSLFSLTVIAPDGTVAERPLPLPEYLQIVAASNFKQRTRMAMLYYHAESRNYAVIGTANCNEHDQGFFVKHGDGGVDVQPIAHLLKTQVYQLAAYLDVPETIRRRPPTTDTYSARQTQEEFFFRIPFALMDLLWVAQANDVPIAQAAEVTGLTEEQVRRAFADFTRKRRSTAYLHQRPVTL